MSRESEIAALKKMIEFEADEEILLVVEGTVNGPGSALDNREGIFYVTNYRLGISAEGSFFTEDAGHWAAFGIVDPPIAAQWSDKSLKVTISGGEEYTLETHFIPDSEAAYQFVEATVTGVVPATSHTQYTSLAEAYESGRFDEVQKSAEALLKKHPACRPVQAALGDALAALGDWASAATAYRAMRHRYADDYYEDTCIFANALLQAGDMNGALEAATEVIDKAPLPQAFYVRTHVRVIRENYDGAWEDIQSAVKLAPDNAKCWSLLGAVAKERRDRVGLAEAVLALERIADPEWPSAIFKVQQLALERNFLEARNLARGLIESGTISRDIGIAFLMAAVEMDAPEEDLPMLATLDPHLAGDDPEYAVCTAFLLLQARSCDEAQRRISAIVVPSDAEPDISKLFNFVNAVFLGFALLNSKKWDEAWRTLEPCLLGEPPSSKLSSDVCSQLLPSICVAGGWALLELGRPVEASRQLRRAEASPKELIIWLRDEFPLLLKRAELEVATISFSEEEHCATPYELLSRLVLELEQSPRLRNLSDQAHTYLKEFDEPPLVAVMGEYSVGKSTFINAILRQQLLPTGEGVTTGTITILRYGEDERMRAVFLDGRVVEKNGVGSVGDFVQETGSGTKVDDLPHHVDVFLRAEVLKRIRIVDSPGLNAPFPEHKRITEEYLNEADGILWLFNVESAGKVTERDFLEKLKKYQRKAVAVVNQIDLVPKDEAQDALEYVQESFPGVFASVHGVSAKKALDGFMGGDSEKLEKSGLPKLESWLHVELLEGSRDLKDAAALQKVREILAEVRVAHEEFDQLVHESSEAIEVLRKNALGWINGSLVFKIADLSDEVKKTVEEEVGKVAKEIVFKISRNHGKLIESSVMEPIARALLSQVAITWREAADSILSDYESFRKNFTEMLQSRAFASWRGVLDVYMREMELNLDSWRKDLLDYIEQVQAFADGFVSAKGLWLPLAIDISEEDLTKTDVVEEVLVASTAFLWVRMGGVLARWQAELETSTNESLSTLERSIREQASEIRENEYRRVERLEILVK